MNTPCFENRLMRLFSNNIEEATSSDTSFLLKHDTYEWNKVFALLTREGLVHNKDYSLDNIGGASLVRFTPISEKGMKFAKWWLRDSHKFERVEQEDLFSVASKGDIAVLKNPNVSKIKDEHGYTPLHVLGDHGNHEILSHPDVDKVATKDGNTPLHSLAWAGNIKALKHSSVASVRNKKGETPLHLLAKMGRAAVMSHPLAHTVKDKYGNTPADIYSEMN